MSYKFLLVTLILLAFADPAFANWWIVRSADQKCLVVDIEPSGKDVTKVGKDVYQTREQAEADVKGLCKNQTPRSHFHSRKRRVRLPASRTWPAPISV